MTGHGLEARLGALARALDAQAPPFDPAVLRAGRSRRFVRRAAVALAVVAALALAPAAVSAFRDLFGVERVPELGPVPYGVAPPFLGRPVPAEAARGAVPFPLRTLGPPEEAWVRDDIAGGMATLAYDGRRILLTQWPAGRVDARIAVVPVDGTAEEVAAGSLRALWIAGAARGTFTLVGADGAVHRELFEVAAGALLWKDGEAALLLQGAGSRERALELASRARPGP
jgi:hypothetical protein